MYKQAQSKSMRRSHVRPVNPPKWICSGEKHCAPTHCYPYTIQWEPARSVIQFVWNVGTGNRDVLLIQCMSRLWETAGCIAQWTETASELFFRRLQSLPQKTCPCYRSISGKYSPHKLSALTWKTIQYVQQMMPGN